MVVAALAGPQIGSTWGPCSPPLGPKNPAHSMEPFLPRNCLQATGVNIILSEPAGRLSLRVEICTVA